jgi:hypothetical protein
MLRLPLPALYLWSSVMICQALVCVALHFRHANKTRSAFTAFSYFALIAGLANAGAIELGNPLFAFWTHAVSSAANSILMLFVALEVYARVYGPRMALPPWVPRKVLTMIGTALAAAVTVVSLLSPRNGGVLTRHLAEGEIGLTLVVLSVFIILLLYSRHLAITWRPRDAGIATGFVLYLGTSLVVLYVRARFPLPVAVIAGHVSMVCYLATLVWWLIVLRTKEEAPVRPSPEELSSLDLAFEKLRTAIQGETDAVEVIFLSSKARRRK